MNGNAYFSISIHLLNTNPVSYITAPLIYTLIAIAYFITILSIIAVVISENRNPVKSLAWVTVLLSLPVIGLILYLFFGRSMKSKRMISRRNKRKLKKRDVIKRIDIDSLNYSLSSKQQINLCRALNNSDYFPGNNIQIFTCGKEKLDQLIEDLTGAKSYINLQYSIL